MNNLLYANKIKKELADKESLSNPDEYSQILSKYDKKVKKIVMADINPKSFSAYQIFDGGAKSIFNEEEGLIEGNYIDEASDKINDDFNSLMNLMK